MGVLGIGGLFFRAKDPDKLAAWYREHLNVGAGCVADPGSKREKYSWAAEGGPVVFQPFKADTDYWPSDRKYMLNLRVHDLDDLIAALTALSIAVITKPEWNDPRIGKFARLHDPEGNPIELWEPPVT